MDGESRTQVPSENGHSKKLPALERLRKQFGDRVPKSAQEETPLNFTNAANVVMANGVDRHDAISVRLQNKFGLGQDQKKRRELYQRLQRIVQLHGVDAYDVINECVADSVGREKPGNYFAYIVVRRLRDRGLGSIAAGGDPTW